MLFRYSLLERNIFNAKINNLFPCLKLYRSVASSTRKSLNIKAEFARRLLIVKTKGEFLIYGSWQ